MMAISDGMGKGKKAYDESSVTIDILENMMEAKIDKEIVINTINNMLLLKSSEEIFFNSRFRYNWFEKGKTRNS